MSLSEGATRARQARRLLQTGAGVRARTASTCGPSCASGGGPRKASWSWPPRMRRTSSSSAGVDGHRAAATMSTIRCSAPPSTRWCATRRATSRSSSSAASRTCKRILVPVRGGPHAELALRFAAALGTSFDAEVDALHVVAADLDPALLSQAERALAMFVRQHAGEAPRPTVASGADVGAEIMRAAAAADLVVMGASVVGTRRRLAVRPAARDGGTGRWSHGHRRPDPRDTHPLGVRAACRPGGDPRGRRACRGDRPQRARPCRSLVRGVELPSRGVRRSSTGWWSSRRSRG